MQAVVAVVAASAGFPAAPDTRLNVLYVVADDLRPELPIYGQDFVKAPTLAALAKEALTFDRAFAQFAICNPSRNSFMTGRRPCDTRTWNDLHSFRDYPLSANWTTLPGAFKRAGFNTMGVGKLFHEGQPLNGDGLRSWSDIDVAWNPWAEGGTAARQFYIPSPASCGGNKSDPATGYGNWCPEDVPASGTGAYFADVNATDRALQQLAYGAKARQAGGPPFFVAVGYRRVRFSSRLYLSAFLNLQAARSTPTRPPPP